MQDLLRIGGDAAETLEAMGYTAIARKREGVVTVEYWKAVGRKQYMGRHVVEDPALGARDLAELCHAQFTAALVQNRV